MATPIASRYMQPSKVPAGSIVNTPTDYWNPAKGLDYTRRLSRVDHGHSVQMSNMRIVDGVLETRSGTTALGGPGYNLMNVVAFLTNTGVIAFIRFKADGIDIWDGITWYHPTGSPLLTGGTSDFFTWTAYNNRLVFSNGVDGMFEYNPVDSSTQKIVGAPSARHLTTFAGRIIASNVRDPISFPSRIRWSVKNNSHDWDGIGSGFDDLLSTPGGDVDIQRGVFPINDGAALIVRNRSLWQMTETGDPDAPFRFGQVYDQLGSDAPYSICRVPGGIVGLFKDNIYIVDGTTPRAIGTLIRHQIKDNIDDVGQAWGAYDFDNSRYFLRVKEGSQVVIYEYSLLDDSWSRHIMPFNTRTLSIANSGLFGLTINSSSGTINAAGSLSINSELGTIQAKGLLYVTSDPVGYVIEDDTTTLLDGDGLGGTTSSEIELQTSLLAAATPEETTYLTEVQLEYEAQSDVVMAIDYTTDKGANWFTYSNFTAQATTGPRMLRCAKTITGHNIQLKLKASTLGRLHIISFVPHITTGQRVAKGQP